MPLASMLLTISRLVSSVPLATVMIALRFARKSSFEAASKEDFLANLKAIMTVAKGTLETKREIVNNMLAKGMMPYTQVYLGHFDNHFSTIGICGMHEASMNF